jgi:histidinol-phosphatase
MDLSSYLEFAMDAAWAAGQSTLAYFQTGIDVERKTDDSPVTAADREAERLLRARITSHFPDHAILGEEFGSEGGSARFRWIIDPIDGTQSFICGVPLYGVLVGLEVDAVASVGVAYFPALGDVVAAATGHGCFWNGRRAHVSGTRALEDAAVGYSDTRMLEHRLGRGWRELQRLTRVQRGWGDCYGHCLVATGRLDVMLDPVMNPWDCAALIPILQEAGGRFTDWTGRARSDGGDAFSTNGHLHEQVLSYLPSVSERSDAKSVSPHPDHR